MRGYEADGVQVCSLPCTCACAFWCWCCVAASCSVAACHAAWRPFSSATPLRTAALHTCMAYWHDTLETCM